jgi:hypothetical protein
MQYFINTSIASTVIAAILTVFACILKSIVLDGWPCHHFVQLDGNFMLEAGNRHFLIAQALVNKTICVTTSDFCFIAENLRIFIF